MRVEYHTSTWQPDESARLRQGRAIPGAGASPELAPFLDLVLADWPTIYPREIEKCLRLPYRGELLLIPQVEIVDNTQLRVPLSRISVTVGEKCFETGSMFRAQAAPAYKELRRLFSGAHDSLGLRLRDVEGDGDSLVLHTQPVSYFDYLRSHLCLDWKKENRKTLRQTIHCGGSLCELQDSPLANCMGLNLLLVSADSQLVIQYRSEELLFRGGVLAPSVSGGIQLEDASGKSETAMGDLDLLREAREELGITDSSVHDLALLGITRELIRGGLPEVFLSGHLCQRSEELVDCWRAAPDRWETRELRFESVDRSDQDEPPHIRAVHRVVEGIRGTPGVTLLAALALWMRLRHSC